MSSNSDNGTCSLDELYDAILRDATIVIKPSTHKVPKEDITTRDLEDFLDSEDLKRQCSRTITENVNLNSFQDPAQDNGTVMDTEIVISSEEVQIIMSEHNETDQPGVSCNDREEQEILTEHISDETDQPDVRCNDKEERGTLTEENRDETDQLGGSMSEGGVKRRKGSLKEEMKDKRLRGKEYIGFRRVEKNSTHRITQNSHKEQRKIGPSCVSRQ